MKKLMLATSILALAALGGSPTVAAPVNLAAVIHFEWPGSEPCDGPFDWSHPGYDEFRQPTIVVEGETVPNPYYACFVNGARSDAKYEVAASECIIIVECAGYLAANPGETECPFSFRGLTPTTGDWPNPNFGPTRRVLHGVCGG